jgi:bacterioferritin (cytochrome b1)
LASTEAASPKVAQPPPKPKLKETKTLEAEKDDMDIVSENLKTHSDKIATEKREAASVEEVSGYSIKLVKMLSGWREVGLPCHRHRSQPPPKPKLKETKTLEAEKDDMDIVSENLKTHSDKNPVA